jgi:hypothetical protein
MKINANSLVACVLALGLTVSTAYLGADARAEADPRQNLG